MLEYHKTTDSEKYEICEWKYSGEYAIYNNPSYGEQLEKELFIIWLKDDPQADPSANYVDKE